MESRNKKRVRGVHTRTKISIEDYLKNKRPCTMESYSVKKQKISPLLRRQQPLAISPTKNVTKSISPTKQPSKQIVSPPKSPRRDPWSASSNVGTLSIREKWCVSIYIFTTLTMFWIVCLGYSVCGVVPCGGSECALIRELSLCQTTWSALAYLTDGIANRTNAYSLQAELNERHKAERLLQLELHSKYAEVERLETQLNHTKSESQSLQREISEWQQKLNQNQKDIHTLRVKLHEMSEKYEDTVAKVKHCKADMKEEIHKKKVCGNKLYPLQSAVETLQHNLTTLETNCNHEKTELSTLLESTQLEAKDLKASHLVLESQAEKDKREIQSLKVLLQTSLLTNGDLTAKVKHCQADMKEEIHKKKVCGEKLYPHQRMVEELQANMTILESDRGRLMGENEDHIRLKEEIIAAKQQLELSQSENNSLKQMIQDLKWSYDETVAKWKHCKADMKEEIFKKKACGEKLYPLQRTIEELQANITSLKNPKASQKGRIPTGDSTVSAKPDLKPKRKLRNFFKRIFQRKQRQQTEL